MNIKELRGLTGQTQKEFADSFGIPVGTLRRWEYGESTPAPYILKLIAEKIPMKNSSMRKIESINGTYYYDEVSRTIVDMKGTRIGIKEKIDGVKEQNLVIYANSLLKVTMMQWKNSRGIADWTNRKIFCGGRLWQKKE